MLKSLAAFGFLMVVVGGGPALAGWPSLSSPPASASGGGERDAAVVVGVEDYAFVPKVPGARGNGNDWLTWLTLSRGVKPSNIRTLWDTEATSEAMEEAAADAAKRVGKGGTLWFIFIGHGAPARSGADGLLVAVDAQQTVDGLYRRSLPQKQLAAKLATGRQMHTVIVVDACFSGQTQAGQLVRGAMPVVPVQFEASKATVLTAGTSREFAGALPGLGRPAFSYLLLGALRGWGDADQDGTVTVQEAADYARHALGTVVRGRTQTPQAFGPTTFALSTRARERGPDLGAFLRAPTAGPVPTLHRPPGRRAADLPLPETGLADLDTGLLDLLQAAKKLEANAEASPASKRQAWSRLAKYKKGKHGLAAAANEHAAAWAKAEGEAKAREAREAAIAQRRAADRATLIKLHGYDDSVVSPEKKAAALAEYERAYGKFQGTLPTAKPKAAKQTPTKPKPAPDSSGLRGSSFQLSDFEVMLLNPAIESRKSQIRAQKILTLKGLLERHSAHTQKADLLFRIGSTMWDEATGAYALERMGRAPGVPCSDPGGCHADYSHAVGYLEQLQREFPSYKRADEVAFYLGRHALDSGLRTGDHNVARAGRKLLETLVQQYPKSPWVASAHTALGEYFFRTDSLYYAKVNFEKVVNVFKTSPSYGYALYRLGWVYINLREFTRARTAFREVAGRDLGTKDNPVVASFRTQLARDLAIAEAELAK